MSKFKVTVTRVDEYEIEIDEKVWDEKALKDWSATFNDVNSVQDIAKDFAVAYMRTESYFTEGYGYVKEFYKDGTVRGIPYKGENGEFKYPLPDEKYAKGISITPLVQDEDYETEIKKL